MAKAPKKTRTAKKARVKPEPRPAGEETRGRPSAYEPEFASRAKDLCDEGATDAELAEEFGVSSRTILTWRRKHPEFCEACTVGKDVADARVERSLYQRAVGYGDMPAEIRAIEYWLNNRCPKRWRNRTQHEVSGPDGGPIKTEGGMSDREAARVIAHFLLTAEEDQAQKKPDEETPPDADKSGDESV